MSEDRLSSVTKTRDFFILFLALASCVPTFVLSTNVFAYALPPRITDLELDWNKNIRNSTAVKAVSVNSLSSQPVLQGVPANLIALGVVGIKGVAQEEAEGVFLRLPMGLFQSDLRKLEYKPEGQRSSPLWSLDLGFKAVAVDNSQNVITAWTSFPDTKLFQFISGATKAYRVKWSGDSQIVRVFACDGRRPKTVVIENVNNGLTRFVFLGRNLSVLGHTIFDLGTATAKSAVTGAFVRGHPGQSCEEFFLTGAFGVVALRYPFGAVTGLE